jgi:hypothetical protein
MEEEMINYIEDLFAGQSIFTKGSDLVRTLGEDNGLRIHKGVKVFDENLPSIPLTLLNCYL